MLFNTVNLVYTEGWTFIHPNFEMQRDMPVPPMPTEAVQQVPVTTTNVAQQDVPTPSPTIRRQVAPEDIAAAAQVHKSKVNTAFINEKQIVSIFQNSSQFRANTYVGNVLEEINKINLSGLQELRVRIKDILLRYDDGTLLARSKLDLESGKHISLKVYDILHIKIRSTNSNLLGHVLIVFNAVNGFSANGTLHDLTDPYLLNSVCNRMQHNLTS